MTLPWALSGQAWCINAKEQLLMEESQLFETRIAGQNMDTQNPGADKSVYNGSATEGFLEPYFSSIPHFSFGDTPLESPVPVMWWRPCTLPPMDLRSKVLWMRWPLLRGKIHSDFRRQHLDNPRYQNLITKLEEVSGWKIAWKKFRLWGSDHRMFSSIVGEVVKVSKNAKGK